MSHAEATFEPDKNPARRLRGRWAWSLLMVLAVAVAMVAWPRTGPLDSRLIGQWTFVSPDGSGIRKFMTFRGDGTSTLERLMPGSAVRTPDSGLMYWWMEGDVVVTQQVGDLATKGHQLAADIISVIRLKKREDRTAFRLKIVDVDAKTLRIAEVTTGVVPYVELEMTRVEDSK